MTDEEQAQIILDLTQAILELARQVAHLNVYVDDLTDGD